MGEKNFVKVYLSEKEESRFLDAIEERFGEIEGRKSEAARMAIREWSDMDRSARNEERLRDIQDEIGELRGLLSDEDNTHTQTQHVTSTTGKSATQKRVDALLNEHLPSEDESAQFRDDEVEDAIRNGLGYTDSRTVRKYKRLLKQRGEVFQHPSGKIWFHDKEAWFDVARYAPGIADKSEQELFDSYPDEVHEDFVEWMERNGYAGNNNENSLSAARADGGDNA